MAKDQTQTDEIKADQTQPDEIIDTTEAEDDKAAATAVKTSEDFDKKLETGGIDESLSEDVESEDKDTKSETADTGKADDKDTGITETADKDTGGDEDALSHNLVDQAIDLGLRMEEISLHKDDAELERTVRILSDIEARKPRPEDKTQAPAKEDVKEDEGIKIENEDEIDPSILKAIRGIESQNKELRQVVERLTGSMEQRRNEEFEERFDSMVDKLGTDYEDVFGKGKGSELNNGANAFRNRKTMVKRMYAIASGYNAAGERIPSEHELFDQALYALHRNKMETVRSKTLFEKGRQQKGRKAGVPASSRTEKPPTGVQKAFQTSRKFDELVDTSE